MTSTRHSGRSPMSMVSSRRRECRDQEGGMWAFGQPDGGGTAAILMPGFMPGIHVFLQAKHLTRWGSSRQALLTRQRKADYGLHIASCECSGDAEAVSMSPVASGRLQSQR